jgi:nicotinamide-nucleotide amidase
MAPELQALCAQLAEALRTRGWMLCTAESCTGGQIAAACTDLAGSSQWFERGFVTYSNEAKSSMLGVAPALIAQYGAVSEAVVRAMVQGALANSQAQVALAVTGIAGPGGGSPDKPVGTVWFGWATPGGIYSECQHMPDDRASVRATSTHHALSQLLVFLDHG